MTTRFAAVTALGSGPGSAPHTTPVAAVHHAGRWWFSTSRRAAKIRLLRRHPVASITVADDDGWTTATGDVTILDPADPSSVLRQPAAAMAAAPAAVSLLGTYARDVAGYLAQAFDVPSAWGPHQRVLVAVEATLVEHSIAPATRRRDESACIAGFSDGRLPLAAPGWFDGDHLRIGAVARPIDQLHGVAVMLDTALLDHDPARPGDQRGVLIRGRLTHRDDALFDVVAGTMTRWDGFDSTTQWFDTTLASSATAANS